MYLCSESHSPKAFSSKVGNMFYFFLMSQYIYYLMYFVLNVFCSLRLIFINSVCFSLSFKAPTHCVKQVNA